MQPNPTVICFFLTFTFYVFSYSFLPAQNVDCDTVQVVAQATMIPLTCDNPVGTLTGLEHPSAQQFWWNGPSGFTAAQRVISRPVPGNYTLTVTGPHGCTAQTTVYLQDDCTDYPLVPLLCNDVFDPPAETCEEACVRLYVPGNYLFNNFDAAPSGVSFYCGTSHNDQWFAFVAFGPTVTVTVQAQNCFYQNGVQLALYGDCGWFPIACNGGGMNFADSLISITAYDLEPGKVYYLMIDGWVGDLCEYFFPIDINNGGILPTNPVNPNVSGPTKVCPGATINYSYNNPPFATAYLWTGPPGTLFNGLPSPALFYVPEGKDVSITFGSDTGFICVRAINYFWPPSKPFCVNIQVTPIPPTDLPSVEVCAEDIPYELPWGDLAFFSGIYEYNYFAYPDCDSLVRQQVIVRPPKLSFLPPMTLCAGECFEIGGTQYCQPGVYAHTLNSVAGCDSTVSFSLAFLNPVAEITGAGELTCSKTSLTLQAQNSLGTQTWKNTTGDSLGSGNTLSVTNPGTYILEVTAIAGGNNCTRSDTVVITQNISQPQIAIDSAGALTCSTTELSLVATSPDPVAAWIWTGPNGFSQPDSVALVQSPGAYELLATGLNGCTSTVTLTVPADQTPPDVALSADTLTCTQNSGLITVQTDLSAGQYNWSGPNGFNSFEVQALVSEPGTYFLTLTNPVNGCSTLDSIEVLADFNLPPVDVIQQAPACGDSLLVLEASSSVSGVLIEWVGPNNFTAVGALIEVTTPGWYQVKASTTSGCHSQIAILVVPAPQNPVVGITGNTMLNCNTPAVPVEATADIPGCSFVWSGPNGFTSDVANPILPFPGSYQLLVTSSSGCTTVVEFEIQSDIEIPEVLASGGVITCTEPAVLLFATSNPPGAQFTWTGPLFNSNENPVSVSEPGTYTVVATLPNGCSGIATAEVVDSCLVRVNTPIHLGNQILLYPNPSTGLVYLQAPVEVPMRSWKLFGAVGNLLLAERMDTPLSFFQLDFKLMPNGVYMLAIQVKDQWSFHRLVLHR